MSLRCLKILSLAALSATALPVLAAAPDPSVAYDNDGQMSASVQVPLNDVNLSSGAGAEKAYRRLERAAEDACGEDWPVRHDLFRQSDVQQCESQAIRDAVVQINQPTLTAVYDRHASRPDRG
jgi:UrcA family protein